MLEEKHMSQNPGVQSSTCKPNREHSDSCIGNDQVILSAILHEQGMCPTMKKVLPNIWEEVVRYIFKDGKEEHERLQVKCLAVVNGSTQDDEFRDTGLDPPINVTSYNNDMKGSPEHRLENILSRKIDEVMLVDWLDDRFP